MSQGVTPCTTLQHVSDIGVTAFMWPIFGWTKRKNSSQLQGQILGEKTYRISLTYDDHIFNQRKPSSLSSLLSTISE
jgi:hypothetical protein